jgi:acyl-CoA reductase-like NAD-dependent aldehyde dehydrogenase
MTSSLELQEAAIERLQAAVTDRRTENIRYRQNQLQSLHAALRTQARSICAALAKDTQATSAEVEAEFYLTMSAVKHFYESLDMKKELREEYQITTGVDNTTRRVGAGLAIIRPTTHTRFYSILTPLCAAIAAGNCVALELDDTLLNTDSELKRLFPKTLDHDTFCISKRIQDEALLESSLLVDQTSQASSRSMTNEIFSSTTTRAIAIVDRTADLEQAARAITAARFSFGGNSPYAPDLVLVNEFLKKDFFEACLRFASHAFAKQGSVVKKASTNASEQTRKVIKDAEAKGHISSFGSADFMFVDVSERTSPIANIKVSGRYLPIVACSGLIDAVFSQKTESPLLAGYFFAEPRTAKFLSQHLDCHITCINQIPTHLLVGPAAPIAHPASYYYRYSKDMFSVPRPQYVTTPPEPFSASARMLDGANPTSERAVRSLATAALAPTSQGKGFAIGFFEQGLLTGAAVVLTVVLPAVTYGTYIVGRKCFEYATRGR